MGWSSPPPLKSVSSKLVATTFYKEFISKYGTSLQVVSENEKQFVSEVFADLYHHLNITHIKTVHFRLQSNLADQVNRILIQIMASFVGWTHKQGDSYIGKFKYALCAAVHDSTGKTLAQLFLGRKVITPFENMTFSPEHISERLRTISFHYN